MPADRESEVEARWRIGRKVGRTIYVQRGPEPSDDDPLIGVMDSMTLAADVVESHNVALDRVRGPQGEDHEAGRTCPKCGPNYIWPDTPEHCSNCGGVTVAVPAQSPARDTQSTPVEWPERQPTDPDRGQLRDAATPASGRGRQSGEMVALEDVRDFLARHATVETEHLLPAFLAEFSGRAGTNDTPNG